RKAPAAASGLFISLAGQNRAKVAGISPPDEGKRHPRPNNSSTLSCVDSQAVGSEVDGCCSRPSVPSLSGAWHAGACLPTAFRSFLFQNRPHQRSHLTAPAVGAKDHSFAGAG